MATMGKILTDCLTELSAMGGLDVQTYMQPKLMRKIQHKCDVLFDQIFWRDLTTIETMTLTGTDGYVTTDLTDKIRRFVDIQYIWPEAYRSPLSEKMRDTPPSRVTQPCFMPDSNATHRFKILPVTFSGSVDVAYRTKPATDYTENDEVPYDNQLITAGTLYDYLVDEGANKEAAAKFKSMFDARYEHLLKLEQKNEKSFFPSTSYTTNEWRDA
jgi:hypothetical protein